MEYKYMFSRWQKLNNSKDLVKVNKILPIMQEHFGQNMNLARIKLMALLLHALCVVQTVSLHKLADGLEEISHLFLNNL